jgi:hypothetical protein
MEEFPDQLWALLVDGACRVVVPHLTAGGFRPIVLKGATIAGWLYPDPSQRVYGDLDLLVAPASRDAVVAALAERGFHPLVDARMLRTSSAEEQPLSNGTVTVDLHTALKGVRLDPARAWAVLDASTVPWDWSGTPVRALAPPARAMHLSLHVAQRGRVDAKAARDLDLGLARLDRAVWHEAARLADELDAAGAFVAGLELLPEGRRLLDELAVAAAGDRETRMRAASASTSALFLERAVAAGSWRQRLRVVRGRLFPSAQWLRLHEPERTRTRRGLILTRVSRPFVVVARLPAAFVERRAFQRRPYRHPG